MVDVDEDTTAGHEASSPPPAASKPHSSPAQSEDQSVPENSSEPSAPPSKESSSETDVDLLALGLRKTGSPRKPAEPEQPVKEKPAKEMDVSPNGTSETTDDTVIEPTTMLAKEPSSGPAAQALLVNGTTTNATTSDTGSAQSPGRVEYLARVHTSSGVVDIPMSHQNLSEEAEVVQRYAEWMKTQGAAQVPFEMFKSIFSIAKKG